MSRIVGAMAGIGRCTFEGETPEGAFSNGDVFAAACNGEALFKVDGGGGLLRRLPARASPGFQDLRQRGRLVLGRLRCHGRSRERP